MGKWVSVKQGDTLISLADENRVFQWETIWNHANNAELKSKRLNPQVLAPNDRIYIPGMDELMGWAAADTGARHVFQRKKSPTFFSVFLKDEQGKPYAGCRYELKLSGTTHQGKTDEQGMICHSVPPGVTEGKLTLWRTDKPDDSHTWELQIGHLNPCESVIGAKARLRNLGYLTGPVNNSADAEFVDALKNFQSHLGQVRPSGELDAATRDALIAQQNTF